ncbi:MAG: hypothetical protein COA78_26445 [Blastopirellula sp.]|nr:MAG: hypothetical protein COA78_26445 [Blastopirellula sp.]
MATDAALIEENSLTEDRVVNAVPFFYGWVMLGVAMVAQFATSPGQTYGVSVFTKHIASSLQIDMTAVAAAYMWGTIFASLPLSLIGAYADKVGIRRMMAIVVGLFALSCCGMSMIQGPISLFFGFLSIRLFGQGAISLLAGTSTDMWFRDRLGMAVGIRNLSIPFSLGIFPMLAIALIQQFEWRTAYVILGIGVCVLMYPILIFVFRNRPEDIGQQPDGEAKPIASVETPEQKHEQGMDLPQLTFGEAIQTRAYWIMISLVIFWGMIATALMFVMIPYLGSRGISESEVKFFVFIPLAISMAVFQLGGGYLADRISLKWLLAFGTLGMAASVWLYASIDSVWGAALYGAVFGASQGIAAAGGGPLWGKYFGRAHLGKIKGSSVTAMVAGSALGPYLLTKGADLYGSYEPVLFVFVAIYILQAIACLFATPPNLRRDDIVPASD